MKLLKQIIFILVIFLKTGNLLSDNNLFNVNNIILEKKGNYSTKELANQAIKGSLVNRLFKEIGLGLINGLILSIVLIIFGQIINQDMLLSLTVAGSMMSVIIISALVGTFIPIILDKQGIDPAIATGPFITTANDIFGIFLFFYIAKLILGF